MSEKTCGTCRHFWARWTAEDGEPAIHGVCGKITNWPGGDVEPALLSRKLEGLDQYNFTWGMPDIEWSHKSSKKAERLCLAVLPTFGCILHEPKPPEDDPAPG